MTRSMSMALTAALLLGCGDGDVGSTEGMTEGSSSGGTTDGPTSSASGGTGPAIECTSKKYWTMGDLESPLMHPGGACLSCHQTVVGEDVATKFGIAGTVYPSFHEADDCNGVDGVAAAAKVEITTADARTLKLPINSAGNFMYDQDELGAILFPITAKVVRGGAEMVMATPQMSGDCNSCHTELGLNGAPGRILLP